MDWKIYTVQEYRKNRSTSDIGRELGKNPKIIRDVLIRAGIPLRGHSQAQKLVIERDGPPIQRPRTEEEKLAISQGLSNFWEGLSPEEEDNLRGSISKRSKDFWANISDEEKTKALKKLKTAANASVGKGSKSENKIASLIAERGFKVERRSTSVIYPYEVDIYVVGRGIGIEIDGPTHFEDVYGIDNLRAVQRRDKLKNAYANSKGVTLIRCRDKTTSYSLATCQRTVDKIVEVINNPPTKPEVVIIDIK